MQAYILELNELGPFPSSSALDLGTLIKYQDLITPTKQPISNDEAKILLKLFGSDDCFGLAWTLVHLIESAADWPLK